MTQLCNAMLLGISTSKPFTMSWKTNNAGTSTSTQITVPTVSSGTYNCVVNWGDGNTSTITTYNDAAWTHTYSGAGTYTVTISGTFRGIQFNNGGDRLKILNISQWGSMRLGNTGSYFYGCSNLTITAQDILDLTGTTTLAIAFTGCASITTIPSINSWNTASITNMQNMFQQCSVFNQAIGSWNTAAVTNMSNMFFIATLFNQAIGSWNTAAVTNMSGMFYLATAFNQNLNSWNTAAVTNMSNMFISASVFNGDITSWNTGAVTTFSTMFQGAGAFNQAIGGWNTANATDMQRMFQSSGFNQSIGSWNTSKVTNMLSMFYSTYFNQDVSTWSIAALTNAGTMFLESGFTITNYNKLLDSATGWPSQATIQSGVTFDAGTAHYSGANAIAGRATLTGVKSWVVSDGGTP